jgi:Tfp pilus assembly protein PilV
MVVQGRDPVSRLRQIREDEDGLTLIELLITATMGVVVMGAAVLIIIAALRAQPNLNQQATNVRTAQWVLARMTREIRNGVTVKEATASKISFETYVRHSTCGGTTQLASTSPAIKCTVTYTCTTTSCSRTESPPGSNTGTPTKIFAGINSDQVFSYGPNATAPTYVKVTLNIPGPGGTGGLTVSDGATLRNATLGY